MWFKTGYNAPSSAYEYLLEWVQQPGVPANPATEGLGMSIAIANGKLVVYTNPWVECGTLAPNTWYHVAVTKDSSELRMYLNGRRIYTGSDPNQGLQVTPLVLGTSCWPRFNPAD